MNTTAPMTPFAIFVINVGVWLVALQGILSRPGDAFPLAASAAATVTNAIAHIGAGFALGTYNPGLATAVLLFLPAAGGTLTWLVRSGNAAVGHVIAAFAWAIGAHVILFVGVLGANAYALFPEIVGVSIILLWMVLPTAFAAHAKTAP